MSRKKTIQTAATVADGPEAERGSASLRDDITRLLDTASRASARAVNAVMTAAYWEFGRRIVEFEQGGRARAEYGKGLLRTFAADLTSRYGRGLAVDNLQRFRPNKVLASEYRTALPDEKLIAKELAKTRLLLSERPANRRHKAEAAQ
ncbi:MAG: hypothetical protein HYU36_16575 [Planctomycetes bacterium]|nr:hypothetical protein [Planctomycetota bacterium]